MEPRHARIHERLQDYWESLRQGRIYPCETDVNPEKIADIWENCLLVSIHEEDLKYGYQYTYLGAHLIEAFADDLTCRDISSRLIETTSQPLVQGFEQVIRTGKPVQENAEFVNSLGMVIKYRSILLPLGQDPQKVDYIIGAMKWRAF